jgi:hypothetical protein
MWVGGMMWILFSAPPRPQHHVREHHVADQHHVDAFKDSYSVDGGLFMSGLQVG